MRYTQASTPASVAVTIPLRRSEDDHRRHQRRHAIHRALKATSKRTHDTSGAVRHQTASARRRRWATSSAPAADALRSGLGAGEDRSYCSAPWRSSCGVVRTDPVFHPIASHLAATNLWSTRGGSLVTTLNGAAYEPAERAVLVEHGATAHAGAETGAHAVTRKRQDGSITGVGGAQHALHFLLHARDFVGEIEGATVL